MGVLVLWLATGVYPVVFTVAGVWTLLATSWLDRHQAWERIATEEERKAYANSHALSKRVGLLPLALGGAVGALAGWMWETELGVLLGIAFGATLGYVLGALVLGFREGLRSDAESAAVPAHAAPPAGDGRHPGPS
jgi:hypothetical protein